MDRLLFKFLVTLVTLPISTSVYAQTSETVYTLAGDVVDGQNCAFTAGQQVTVSDLLNYAGQNRNQGNSFVLRGWPLKSVLSEHFNPGVPSRNAKLVPGDIVVFRALADWQSPNQNVILVTDNGSEILNFQATDRIQLGHLLGTTPPAPTVSVVRTGFDSAKVLQLPIGEFVQNGDVVDVRTTATMHPEVVSNDTLTSTVGTSQSVSSTNSTMIDNGNSLDLTIPGVNNTRQEASPFDLASSGNVVKEPGDNPFAVHDFAVGVPQTTDAAASDVPKTTLAASADSENGSMWNALFVLGLVFASGLIVIGWVKTQQEREQEKQTADQLRTSISTNNERTDAEAEIRTADPGPQVAVGAPVESMPSVSLAASADANAEPPKDLTDELWVETEETTSRDLPVTQLNAETEPATGDVDDDCPVLSAGFAFKADSEFCVETLGESLNISSEASAKNETVQSEALANALVGSDEWFGADWRTSDTKSNQQLESPEKSETLVQSLESPLVANENTENSDEDEANADDTIVESLEARSRAPKADGTFADIQRRELEDLIHNRLPIDLQQIRLPLRINLFGKPSGPQRLRIDNAHTQIAPPHMMSKARRGRRPQSVGIPAGQEVTMEPKQKTQTPETAQDADTSFPGLDKALNFLDEQADS